MTFRGLAVAEMSVSFLSTNGPRLSAKLAFVNPKTGDTHGWTEKHTWSPPVLQKLEELAKVMEEDAAKQHLQDFAQALTADTDSINVLPEGGLLEHLGVDLDAEPL